MLSGNVIEERTEEEKARQAIFCKPVDFLPLKLDHLSFPFPDPALQPRTEYYNYSPQVGPKELVSHSSLKLSWSRIFERRSPIYEGFSSWRLMTQGLKFLRQEK